MPDFSRNWPRDLPGLEGKIWNDAAERWACQRRHRSLVPADDARYGHDRVLNGIFGHAMVFQIPQSPRLPYGSRRAFGHDGAGGGCADPTYDSALGYGLAPIAYPGGADAKGVHPSQITRRILAGLQ